MRIPNSENKDKEDLNDLDSARAGSFGHANDGIAKPGVKAFDFGVVPSMTTLVVVVLN